MTTVSTPAAQDTPLAGNVALVPAGAPAWTLAACRALMQAGAGVVLAGGPRNALPAGLSPSGVLQGAFHSSVQTDAAVAKAVSQYGRLDILVNLPQHELFLPAADLTDGALRALLEQNVESAYRWSRSAGLEMAARKRGNIITFVSGLSRRGLANGSAFAMTQAALDAMTQSLALEWAAAGVRANGIGYGWVDTEGRPIEEQQKDRLVRFLPLRRKGQLEDYMGLLVYLASDASGFVTGQTVFIDGGAMVHA